MLRDFLSGPVELSGLFTAPPEQISIAQQVREAERELAFRLSVYPRRVGAGRMRQDQADRQIHAQRAIVETLREVQAERKG
jgi:hypothetical protein